MDYVVAEALKTKIIERLLHSPMAVAELTECNSEYSFISTLKLRAPDDVVIVLILSEPKNDKKL